MKVVETYATKAKWALDILDSTGCPLTGYYRDGRAYDVHRAKSSTTHLGDIGDNYIVHGTLILVRTERGRSAASFIFNLPDVPPSHIEISTTLSGMEKIIDAASHGLVALGRGILYNTIHHTANANGLFDKSIKAVEGPAFTGYWTFAKQGSEVSIIPAPEDILSSLGIV